MSRAEASPTRSSAAGAGRESDSLPPPPTIRAAARAAALDVYFHLIRVVPINLLFGIWLLVALVAWANVGPLAAVLLGVLLAIPLSGLARLGALAARGEDLNLTDAVDPVRERPAIVLGAWAVFLLGGIVLGVNLVTGLAGLGTVGVALATLALWGLLVLFALGFAFWPLLVDPWRAGRPARTAARLAGFLVLAHPVRLGAITVFLLGVLVASTIAFAAILMISVGFVMFAAARYVLPAADRLELRLCAAGRPIAATPPTPPTGRAHPA